MLDHSTLGTTVAEGSRFAKLLGGTDGPPEIWDTVILETDDFLVVPTLGSIIPNWLLVVPKHPALNFRDHLDETAREGVSLILGEITNEFDERNLLWFEHGAHAPGSAVGCGTDYAHLHILLSPPFNLAEFKEAVFQARSTWNAVPTDLSHAGFNHGCEYYVFGDHYHSYRLDGIQDPESQFFRKIVATLVGQGDKWNYRAHPNAGNAQLTVDMLAKGTKSQSHYPNRSGRLSFRD